MTHPGITPFSNSDPQLAHSRDPADVFSEAMTVPASDLALAASAAREEAIRLRETGDFVSAQHTAGTAVNALQNRLSLYGTETAPIEYEGLSQELVGTALLQADLAATTGDFTAVQTAAAIAMSSNRRVSSEKRANVIRPVRAAYEELAQTAPFLGKLRARVALRKLPQEKHYKPLEKQLKIVDQNIEAAQQYSSNRDIYRIGEDWLKHGDEELTELARILAVHRMPETAELEYDHTKEGLQRNILVLAAKQGNEDAAHDLLNIAQEYFRPTNTRPPSYLDDLMLCDALLAGLFVHDQTVVDSALALVEQYRQNLPENWKSAGLIRIDAAIPAIRAGEWDPNKIPGLFKPTENGETVSTEILLGILDQKPFLPAPR